MSETEALNGEHISMQSGKLSRKLLAVFSQLTVDRLLRFGFELQPCLSCELM